MWYGKEKIENQISTNLIPTRIFHGEDKHDQSRFCKWIKEWTQFRFNSYLRIRISRPGSNPQKKKSPHDMKLP